MPVAEVTPHDELEAGRGDRRARTASPAAWRPARPGQDGVPGPRRPLGPHPAPGRSDVLRLEAHERCRPRPGDLIGVDGTAFKSRRGELSLGSTHWQLLAKSLRPPPEKFHGLEDVETRYRQRYLDLIANEETRELFILRGK